MLRKCQDSLITMSNNMITPTLVTAMKDKGCDMSLPVVSWSGQTPEELMDLIKEAQKSSPTGRIMFTFPIDVDKDHGPITDKEKANILGTVSERLQVKQENIYLFDTES
jgi:hypothetical protein